MPANSNPVPPVFNLPFVAPGSGMLTAQALQFLQLLWSGPAGTSGVFGPPTSVVGDVALWANTTGTLLSDGGAASDFVFAEISAQLVPGANITITPGGGNTLIIAASSSGSGDVHGPGSSGDGNLVLFNGTTGKIIKDAGLPPGNLAFLSTITASLVTNFAATVLADVTAILVAGLNISITPSGSTLIISSASSTPLDYWGAYENNIRTANSGATNSTNLDNLMAAIAGAGGGLIWFNEPGTYQFSGTITLRSLVSLQGTGCIFQWTGSTSGVIFTTSITEVMWGVKLINIILDEGASFTGIALNLHSHMYCYFDVLGVGLSTGTIFFFAAADSTAGEHTWGPENSNRNTAFNDYKLRHQGKCSDFITYEGIAVGFAGGPQGFTLNTFHSAQGASCYHRGIKPNNWADSNTFVGNTLVGMYGANSIGLIVNEGADPSDSVYNTHFQHLAIDTFGTGLNRFGVVLNGSRGMTCSEYFNVPNAENGTFTDGGCLSYLWTEQLASNALYQHQKNFSVGP